MQHSDVSGSAGNMLEVEKPVADLHSTSSYRLYSSRTGADTALIIQTSVRQQKDTEAFFFFFGSQCAIYLPWSSSTFQSDPHLSEITSLSAHRCQPLTFFFSQDTGNSFYWRSWPADKSPGASLHLSTFLGILKTPA